MDDLEPDSCICKCLDPSITYTTRSAIFLFPSLVQSSIVLSPFEASTLRMSSLPGERETAPAPLTRCSKPVWESAFDVYTRASPLLQLPLAVRLQLPIKDVAHLSQFLS